MVLSRKVCLLVNVEINLCFQHNWLECYFVWWFLNQKTANIRKALHKDYLFVTMNWLCCSCGEEFLTCKHTKHAQNWHHPMPCTCFASSRSFSFSPNGKLSKIYWGLVVIASYVVLGLLTYLAVDGFLNTFVLITISINRIPIILHAFDCRRPLYRGLTTLWSHRIALCVINNALWCTVCHSYNKMTEKKSSKSYFCIKKSAKASKLPKLHCAS